MPIFEVLNLKHKELVYKLYNLCYRLTGDKNFAQEICLQTMAKLQRDKLLNHAEGIFIKAAKVAVQLLQEQEYNPLLGSMTHDEEHLKIQQALNYLPLEERVVIVLKHTYALTYPEIEEIIQYEDVSYLLQKGRQRLTHILNTCLQ